MVMPDPADPIGLTKRNAQHGDIRLQRIDVVGGFGKEERLVLSAGRNG